MTDTQTNTSRDWLDRLSRHRTGLATLSFAESTIVPIPLETVVAPLMVGHPRRALTIAAAIWIGCLIGATVFYIIGFWAVDPIVRPALQTLGLIDDFDNMADKLGREGLFWTVFLVSFSPAPMQLATLGAGAAQGNFLSFIAAIALSRGLRYFGLAVFAQFIGERIARLRIRRRYLIVGLMVILALVWGVFQLI